MTHLNSSPRRLGAVILASEPRGRVSARLGAISHCFRRFFVMLPFLGTVALSAAPSQPLQLGANFNEHLDAAKVPALDATGVTWIRGFLPAGEFLDGRRTLATDPGIAAFRAAAASGRRIAITLKWDFKRSNWRVPAPDSADEKKAFAWAVDVVRETRPDLLLLVNEVFIDTHEADMQPGADGVIPMVRFLQRLAAFVHSAGLKSPSGAPLPLSCGGFTRLDRPEMQQRPATRALLSWLATTPDLTYVNFHLHEPTLAEFETALKFIHEQLPNRPFVVTEFSLVWSYQAHLKDRLDADEAGRAFAEKFHRPADETVRQYLNAAARAPVTEEELHAFLGSRSWFDPESLEKCCRLMEQNGVTLATYAYLQEAAGLSKPGQPVSGKQPPWRLNPIFQEQHAYVPGSSRFATNLGFYDTFVQRQSVKAKPAVRRDAPETIRGAIYVPAEAYNAPQMWKNFSVDETRRDFGYARKINLNALRLWASYEYWRMEPDRFKASFDQMLGVAQANGIRILVSLFENCGVVYTGDEMWTTDPHKAFAMLSPNPNVVSPTNQAAWGGPREFVQWFMTTYRNDDRLLAIEVMNEPREKPLKQPPSVPFAKSMFVTAKSLQGTVPLTIGFAESEKLALEFIPSGLDIIEFHDNYPASAQDLEKHLRAALELGAKYNLPVWLGEWQRVRPSGTGFDNQVLTPGEIGPDYESLAAVVRKYPVGSFFWSLMVKRAYLPPQRAKGTINGLFWSDGSVWSLADARAIAGDPHLNLVEQHTPPPGFP
jgi:hypothetical protein